MNTSEFPFADPSGPVLGEAALALYRSLLAEGPRVRERVWSGAERTALRQLIGIGLVAPQPVDNDEYVLVDPLTVRARWGEALHAHAGHLLEYAAGLPRLLQDFSDAFHQRAEPVVDAGRTEYIEGKPLIRRRISQLISASTREVVTAQPGHRAPASLEAALKQDLPMLGRGVARRTLYQSSVRHTPTVRNFIRELSRAGGEVRTLEEPFERVFIFDRRTVVMPVNGEHDVAATTDDPATVSYVLSVFERDWTRADPFDDYMPHPADPLGRTQRVIVRLLAEGLGQQAIASRLSLSQRTVAAHIAKVREQYGADTLFQLAWRMGREEGRRQGGEAADTP
ncbi:LuxR C-terminal-related transcriptional regulator [Streptomyces sp. NPDC001380]|uniref:LuxR C-terminal-related transcriptional regulator n=1 Tax=Streptomyces sp. NPDC001380 TaxID=3364566 RepID=UPI00369CC055